MGGVPVPSGLFILVPTVLRGNAPALETYVLTVA